MEDLRSDLDKLHLSAELQEIMEQLISHAETEQTVIGLFGSFSVGKSELLNKIIDRVDLLPTHTNETTAIITTITYDDEDKIELIYNDGIVEMTSKEKLHTLTAGGTVTDIEKIAISLSHPKWLKQVSFIDTPGRNTKFAAHVEASKQAIIDADAAVYVLPWQGLTDEDIVYLKDLMIFQPNLYFILNKVDRIDETQGQTIEDIRLHVEKELINQLGKRFPVYAISAKTGYQLSSFIDEFIPQMTNNMKDLKQKRFTHAISELITNHARSIENEINLLELANQEDEQVFQDQKRKIEVEQTKLNGYVNKELSLLKEVLAGVQLDSYQYIEDTVQKAVEDIKKKLLTKFTPMQETEALNTVVGSYLLTARNQIYQRFEDKLDVALRDKNQYKLSELESSDVNIRFPEPSFEELHGRYQERLQELARQYENKKNRLEMMLNDSRENGLDEDMTELQQAMLQLEEQMREEYIPEYLLDESFDPNRAEKISKYIGVAGDIALSIALAVATAGVSAGAQAAGKAGAEAAKTGGKLVMKEVGEKVTKEAVTQAIKETGVKVAQETAKQAAKETGVFVTQEGAKQAAKKAGEQIAKEAVKEAGGQVVKEVAKQGGKETLKKVGLESLKVIGKFASPVETAATAIGQAIDSSRKAETVLDTEHRQKFFLKKQQIESQFQKKKSELNQLKEQQKSNAGVVRNIVLKLEQMEKNQEEEVKGLELSMKRDQAQVYRTKFEENVQEQLDALIFSEQDMYKSWVKLELDKVVLMLESTLPSYYQSEFTKLMQKMDIVESQSKSNKNSITEKLADLKLEHSACHELKQRITND